MSERLFFALWPDEGIRSQLRERALPSLLPLRGKPQRPEQWHVTLLFLGDVPVARRAELLSAAQRCGQTPAFTVTFDAIEHWRRARVVCLTASVLPLPLRDLVQSLGDRLREAAFALDPRPYRPHVTLARKVSMARDSRLTEPVVWHADRFTLVRSVTDPAGSRYEPVQWWNLGTDEA